jgi:hypothetical protein
VPYVAAPLLAPGADGAIVLVTRSLPSTCHALYRLKPEMADRAAALIKKGDVKALLTDLYVTPFGEAEFLEETGELVSDRTALRHAWDVAGGGTPIAVTTISRKDDEAAGPEGARLDRAAAVALALQAGDVTRTAAYTTGELGGHCPVVTIVLPKQQRSSARVVAFSVPTSPVAGPLRIPLDSDVVGFVTDRLDTTAATWPVLLKQLQDVAAQSSIVQLVLAHAPGASAELVAGANARLSSFVEGLAAASPAVSLAVGVQPAVRELTDQELGLLGNGQTVDELLLLRFAAVAAPTECQAVYRADSSTIQQVSALIEKDEIGAALKLLVSLGEVAFAQGGSDRTGDLGEAVRRAWGAAGAPAAGAAVVAQNGDVALATKRAQGIAALLGAPSSFKLMGVHSAAGPLPIHCGSLVILVPAAAPQLDVRDRVVALADPSAAGAAPTRIALDASIVPFSGTTPEATATANVAKALTAAKAKVLGFTVATSDDPTDEDIARAKRFVEALPTALMAAVDARRLASSEQAYLSEGGDAVDAVVLVRLAPTAVATRRARILLADPTSFVGMDTNLMLMAERTFASAGTTGTVPTPTDLVVSFADDALIEDAAFATVESAIEAATGGTPASAITYAAPAADTAAQHRLDSLVAALGTAAPPLAIAATESKTTALDPAMEPFLTANGVTVDDIVVLEVVADRDRLLALFEVASDAQLETVLGMLTAGQAADAGALVVNVARMPFEPGTAVPMAADADAVLEKAWSGVSDKPPRRVFLLQAETLDEPHATLHQERAKFAAEALKAGGGVETVTFAPGDAAALVSSTVVLALREPRPDTKRTARVVGLRQSVDPAGTPIADVRVPLGSSDVITFTDADPDETALLGVLLATLSKEAAKGKIVGVDYEADGAGTAGPERVGANERANGFVALLRRKAAAALDLSETGAVVNEMDAGNRTAYLTDTDANDLIIVHFAASTG